MLAVLSIAVSPCHHQCKVSVLITADMSTVYRAKMEQKSRNKLLNWQEFVTRITLKQKVFTILYNLNYNSKL